VVAVNEMSSGQNSFGIRFQVLSLKNQATAARAPKIAKSGQYMPHRSQPVQASGFTACGGWYPLLLNLSEDSSTADGQKAIQNPQPLHNSALIATVPRGRLIVFTSAMDSLLKFSLNL
jgi:hypothetical protein